MKKLIVLALAIFALAVTASAQTTCASSTTAGLCSQWVAPAVTATTAAAATYNLYQQATTGTSCVAFTPTKALQIASSIGETIYTQATVPTGNVCTEVTAVSSAGVEGPASAAVLFSGTTPPPLAPGAPTGLTQVKH